MRFYTSAHILQRSTILLNRNTFRPSSCFQLTSHEKKKKPFIKKSFRSDYFLSLRGNCMDVNVGPGSSAQTIVDGMMKRLNQR